MNARMKFRNRLREIAGVPPMRVAVAEPEPAEPVVAKRSRASKGKAASLSPDRPHAGDEGESGRSN